MMQQYGLWALVGLLLFMIAYGKCSRAVMVSAYALVLVALFASVAANAENPYGRPMWCATDGALIECYYWNQGSCEAAARQKQGWFCVWSGFIEDECEEECGEEE